MTMDSQAHNLFPALPFSAVPTPFLVRAGEVRYWANCAWDSLAVPVALHADAEIETRWADGDDPFGFRVRDGSLESEPALVHFSVPARRPSSCAPPSSNALKLPTPGHFRKPTPLGPPNLCAEPLTQSQFPIPAAGSLPIH